MATPTGPTGERPQFYRGDGGKKTLLDGLYLYLVPYDPDPQNFMMGNTSEEYCLVKGQTETKSGKLKHIPPGDYYAFLSKQPITDAQRAQMQGKPAYCQRINVIARSQRKGGLQQIPLFDYRTITSIDTLKLGDLESIKPRKTFLKVYIPTAVGGMLTIQTSASVDEVSVHYLDGVDEDTEQVLVRSAVGGGGGKLKGTVKGNLLTYDVPFDKIGWYYIRVDNPGDVDVSNTLVRDTIAWDNGPWVPPNFWYYPFLPRSIAPNTGKVV